MFGRAAITLGIGPHSSYIMIRALHVKQFHAAKNDIFRSSIEYFHERSTKSKFQRIKLTFRNGITFRAVISLHDRDRDRHKN